MRTLLTLFILSSIASCSSLPKDNSVEEGIITEEMMNSAEAAGEEEESEQNEMASEESDEYAQAEDEDEDEESLDDEESQVGEEYADQNDDEYSDQNGPKEQSSDQLDGKPQKQEEYSYNEYQRQGNSYPQEYEQSRDNSASVYEQRGYSNYQNNFKAPSTTMYLEQGHSTIGEYTVKGNETLMLIAFKIYGDYTKWKLIKQYNPRLNKSASVYAGDKIIYPLPKKEFTWKPLGEPYLIKKNESLSIISKNVYSTYKRWPEIYQNNRPLIKDPNLIFAGFTIFYVPDTPFEQTPTLTNERDLATLKNK